MARAPGRRSAGHARLRASEDGSFPRHGPARHVLEPGRGRANGESGGAVSDKETVEEFFRRTSMIERFEPVLAEIIWVVCGCQGRNEHAKLLPEYCYRIFEILIKT